MSCTSRRISTSSTGTTSAPPCCRTPSGPTPTSSSDPAYADQTTKLIKASIKGWVYARDNPEEAAKIVADAGSTLGESHQLWMTNEINKLIWPSTAGIGTISDEAWKQTVDIALGTKNETGATIITKAAAGDREVQ